MLGNAGAVMLPQASRRQSCQVGLLGRIAIASPKGASSSRIAAIKRVAASKRMAASDSLLT
jgi:hypothetical protein